MKWGMKGRFSVKSTWLFWVNREVIGHLKHEKLLCRNGNRLQFRPSTVWSLHVVLLSSPRDNLLLIKNFKNPETATVSGFSFCLHFPIWCKFGANPRNIVFWISKFQLLNLSKEAADIKMISSSCWPANCKKGSVCRTQKVRDELRDLTVHKANYEELRDLEKREKRKEKEHGREWSCSI